MAKELLGLPIPFKRGNMKIEKTDVTKLMITGVDGNDPIAVIIQDLGPGRGKINIDCYDKTWSSYWGAMGDETIAEFFCSCDEHYLAKNLSSLDARVFDADAINEQAEKAGLHFGRDDPWNDWELMTKLYGPDMYDWSDKIPKIPNHEYEYLCKVIGIVQDALRKDTAEEKATIKLNGHETQSGLNRQKSAEGLIIQLPVDHDGRNTWLMNYGISEEARALRAKHNLEWDAERECAGTVSRQEERCNFNEASKTLTEAFNEFDRKQVERSLEQCQDIRKDRETLISMLAQELGVAIEPHQSFEERLFEAATKAAAGLTAAEEAHASLHVGMAGGAYLLLCDAMGEEPIDLSDISDGHHTFKELYEHRHQLFIALMKIRPGMSWRSKRHEDGTMYDDWFIAGMRLTTGDISYHLPNRLWDSLGNVEVLENAPRWDGYTSTDVLNRLSTWYPG